jgi:SHS family lactate transporter-like MFS transporter
VWPGSDEVGTAGSWGIGFLLSSLVYGLLYQSWGWRGMLWIGILPAFVLLYVRFFVKEPEVWLENRRRQREQKRKVRAPLLSIFKPMLLANTLTACWWMASGFIVYYSIWALFATHLQKDLNLSPGSVAAPIAIANIVVFLASAVWGMVADQFSRRWSMIAPALIAIVVAPVYLLSNDITWIVLGFVVQGAFGGAIYGQNPSYLSERFPTEVRATASAFCYNQGAIWGGFTAPVLVYFASAYHVTLAIPMLIGTVGGLISFILAVLCGPETKGKILVPDLLVT